MENHNVTRVRFPNESYYDEITNFNIEDFTPINWFAGEIFGTWKDTHVAIMREDYERLTNSRDYDKDHHG